VCFSYVCCTGARLAPAAPRPPTPTHGLRPGRRDHRRRLLLVQSLLDRLGGVQRAALLDPDES
jgi:hypothetical protein